MTKKNYLQVFLILCTLLVSIKTSPQKDRVYDRNYGIWSIVQSPFQQQNAKGLPPQYYVCGFQMKLKNFVFNAWNCNCGSRWYRGRKSWRCNWCPNTVQYKSNGINLIFCSYKNWADQKEISFTTGDSENSGWAPKIMCPAGTYAKGANPSFGWQHNNDQGFNGLLLICQPISQSSSTKVWHSLTNQWIAQWNGNKGQFISAVKFKYVSGGMLTGIQLICQAMPQISKIVLKYNLQGVQYQPYLIQRKQISNNGGQPIQITQNFTQTVQQQRTFKTEQVYKKGYMISTSVSIQFKVGTASASASSSFGIYSEKSSTFEFGSKYVTTWSAAHSLMVLVSPFKKVTLDQILFKKFINVPYVAEISFVNRITKEPIGKSTVEGVFEGVNFQKIETKLQQSGIVKE